MPDRLADADRLDRPVEDRVAVYYTALLINVACHSDAHEQSKWMGDDVAMRSTKYDYEPRSLAETFGMLRRIGGPGNPPLHRVRTGLALAVSGRHDLERMIEQHAALARQLALQLELPATVADALGSSYERWDGKGWPGALHGAAIPLASQLAQLAEYVEVAHRTDGVAAAVALAERRRGSQFDPQLVDALHADADKILDGLDELVTWDAVIGAEPGLAIALTPGGCDAALAAIARFVDLKSPYTLGHSTAVAELAAAAGQQLGLDPGETRTLHRAGLVAGFGRLGVSNTIWDKRGPLGAGEWERVRLHPYYTERMLQQSDALAPLGHLAVQCRERLDGSGYPRGLTGSSISRSARVLGAADAYQAMREPRPHRDALSATAAATELRAEVKAGRLESDAVEAVLIAAGHRAARRREGIAGLTAREVEVLRLLALGRSTKDIAARLVISPKTVGNHIEHIYTKIGVTSRAAAALFAMQHGLLPDEGFDGSV